LGLSDCRAEGHDSDNPIDKKLQVGGSLVVEEEEVVVVVEVAKAKHFEGANDARPQDPSRCHCQAPLMISAQTPYRAIKARPVFVIQCTG